MTGKAWLILSILCWLAFEGVSDWWLLTALASLYLWMRSEYRQTGEQPNLRRMIERNIVRGNPGRRRKRRRH